MAQKLLGSNGALEGIWPLGRKQNCVNPYKREDSGGSGVAQKLLESIGVLEGAWPLGRGQNCVNPCKRGDSGGSGVAQKLLDGAGRWRVYGHWEGGKTCKSL